MLRTAILALSLLSILPLAAADEVCAGPACVVVNPDDRFSWYGVYFYEENSGAFGSAGYGEGSGFFGDTATADVFAYDPTTGQWVVLVVAMNDYDRDGDHEDTSAFVGTWNDLGPGVGEGFHTPLP